MQISSRAAERCELLEFDSEFAREVLEGLSRPCKSLPCRFFYDETGSELFEQITRLPEYYPTRTETGILTRHAAEIVADMPDDGMLIEFGSGSSTKTEILLAQAPRSIAYVPIDVSASALGLAQARLKARFPRLSVRPLIADFSHPVVLPADLAKRQRTGFFPGSTIGNLTPPQAVELLRAFKAALTAGSRLIIGIDLKKDARQLVLAYNDTAGVTAAFNLNLLARINRELGGNIDLALFRHEAIYDPREGRIEMHLVSTVAQEVWVSGRRFHFEAGERIHTENSYKYSVAQFHALAKEAGWTPMRTWTDRARQFSVHELISR